MVNTKKLLSKAALAAIAQYIKKEFALTGKKAENPVRLQSRGFEFSGKIVQHTLSGSVVVFSEISEKDRLNAVRIAEPLDTHAHGREYHNRVGRIGLEIGMP